MGDRDPQQIRKFLEEYTRDRDARAAARRAGFGERWAHNTSYKVLKENRAFIVWYEALIAQAAAKQIGIELEPVLQELALIAFANEHDYLVQETDPKTGQIRSRRKRLDELTRGQMAAIRVKGSGQKLEYELLDKEARLVDLGKHLGAFNEKLILEHRHAHLHAHIDLGHVSLTDLEALERQIERHLLPHEKAAS